MDGWIEIFMEKYLNGWIEKWMHAEIREWTNGWREVDGGMDREMDRGI